MTVRCCKNVMNMMTSRKVDPMAGTMQVCARVDLRSYLGLSTIVAIAFWGFGFLSQLKTSGMMNLRSAMKVPGSGKFLYYKNFVVN